MFIATLADANIRAQVLNDTLSANFLAIDVPDSPLVHLSEFAWQCSDA